MNRVRIGTLGAARITADALLKPAALIDEAEVVGVAARDPERAREFAAKHDIPTVYETYDELIADPNIDAIYNPLPNSHHAPWTLKAIAAGKHVLCEKPFTANADEAQVVADAAAAAPSLVVMEAFHYRYHPLIARVLDLIADGAVGRVQAHRNRDVFPADQARRHPLAARSGRWRAHGCRVLRGPPAPDAARAETMAW